MIALNISPERKYLIDTSLSQIFPNLYRSMVNSSIFWNFTPRGLYHETVSLILSQMVNLTLSRQIRSDLYILLDSNIITYDNIRKINKELLLRIGITEKKLKTIEQIPNCLDNNRLTNEYLEEISKIKGIGKWTINGLKMIYCYEDIYLSSDKYINKIISILLNINNITEDEIKYIWEFHLNSNKRNFSMFFWRIKTKSLKR